MTGDRPIRVEPVDRAEVTIVVDNFVDVLMAGSDGVRRYLATDFGGRDQLIAEHGFSALITVELHGRRRSVLYDGGLTPTALARNLDILQVPVRDLRALVISHGHADHLATRAHIIGLPSDSPTGLAGVSRTSEIRETAPGRVALVCATPENTRDNPHDSRLAQDLPAYFGAV